MSKGKVGGLNTMQAIGPGNQRIPSYAPKSVSSSVRSRLAHLVAPHVDSFDYFLGPGLEAGMADLQDMEILLKERRPGLETPEGEEMRLTISFEDLDIEKPYRTEKGKHIPITPREAREAGISYTGAMLVTCVVRIDEDDEIRFRLSLGNVPIMVMSEKCHLKGLSQKQLIDKKEEQTEAGGYFLLNGIERVIRLLQVPRRNFAAAIERSSYKNRGTTYSDKGVAMRCVRKDQSSITMTMHYLTSGGATLRFVLRKQEFLLPVVIVAKALAEVTDKEIYDRILNGDHLNTFLRTRLEVLLRDAKQPGLDSREACRAFLGSRFRAYLPITEDVSDADAGKLLLQRFFFVHTDIFGEKFECLLHMMRKLFTFAAGQCSQDNPDALSNHELLLPGHLVGMILKEKLEEALLATKQAISRDYNINRAKTLTELRGNATKYVKRILDRSAKGTGAKIGTFLSTGNIISSSGLDLQQVSGYTIVAERLNIFRYHSHFQSVHRGQFFTTMKTTAVRKLLPESWGFLCPVHTPDGSPCGLLNHLSRECVPVSFPTGAGTSARPPTTPTGLLESIKPSDLSSSSSSSSSSSGKSKSKSKSKDKGRGKGKGKGKGKSDRMDISDDGSAEEKGVSSASVSDDSDSEGDRDSEGERDAVIGTAAFKKLLADMGMVPAGVGGHDGQARLSPEHVPVVLDGVPVGGILARQAGTMVSQLRILKCTGGMGNKEHYIDPTMEVALLPRSENPRDHSAITPFPGVFIHTQPGRMIRPVLNLMTKTVEYIGPMEQVFMDIACLDADIDKTTTTHMELSPSQMLSQVAALTPFSDYNQSPRNMYQCQMGKQTMGTPTHAFRHRADNKLYRIQTPQSPIVQTQPYRDYGMDEYAQGTNAVVCVISYTGYDMEDAMIINKAAFERGFGYGCMYKTYTVDLDEEERKGGNKETGRPSYRFGNVKKPPMPSKKGSDDRRRRSSIGGGEEDGVEGMDEEDDEEGPGGDMAGEKYVDDLDWDGLPEEGEQIAHGQALVCFIDSISGEYRTVKHKESEKAYVQTVRVLAGVATGSGGASTGSATGGIRKVSITLRFPRQPIIGDKFSSRHGQKGTLSVLWPQESMPFTESGITPDILINPHAFPSRMTIGMLMESMAGKAGGMHGMYQDGSPFMFHEEHRAVDYIGEQLVKSGYNYYGSEPLYSGQSGQLMECKIFIGLVYYQRLRHMVSDKSQVRSTGPVTALTRQPVKGRKKHGGIRLGEMERDALLSHGVAFCLHDRLMACSDTHIAHVCSHCGELVGVHQAGPDALMAMRSRERLSARSPAPAPAAAASSSSSSAAAGARSPEKDGTRLSSVPGLLHTSYGSRSALTCSGCGSVNACQPVHLPYVYRYLANELAGMGVKLSLKLG